MAFMLERLILAMAGGVLGCLLSMLTNGLSGSAWASLGDISFAFRVTPVDLGYGLLFASAMGVMGSLLPASRAALLPVTLVLRQA
jgi:putative ABC transport system permease protein